MLVLTGLLASTALGIVLYLAVRAAVRFALHTLTHDPLDRKHA